MTYVRVAAVWVVLKGTRGKELKGKALDHYT
jgi:hypothetical protein